MTAVASKLRLMSFLLRNGKSRNMKKIFTLFMLLFSVTIVYGQLSGDGTKNNPYSGTMEEGGDVTWSSDTYIDGTITIDDEKLTISPGVNIIFVEEGTDLIVTGTGQIEATGNSGSMIYFTADNDKDDIFGESGETWGHIVFQSMDDEASQSTFEYCDIAYGDARNSTITYGGAFYINDFDDVSISRCDIQNNSATHGGAFALWKGSSPTIEFCIISHNSANTSGGGFYTQGSANITNSIITQNTTGNGGGGAVFSDGANNISFTNCVLAGNSTSSTTKGHSIHFYNINTTIRPEFVNCIIWGNANSISYSTTDAEKEEDFQYCAIQDSETPASSFYNCFDLDSDNSEPDGPNFVATDGSDWSILFVSPCRDSGTNSGVPSTDISGNNRVRTTDIGAYEVQYREWTGGSSTNDWSTAGNWLSNLIPTSGESDVYIPAGLLYYPNPVSTTQDFTIAEDKYFIIEPGASVTLDDLSNNGTLHIKADENDHSSLIVSNYSGNPGLAEIYLTGGVEGVEEAYKWHYISTPFTTASSGNMYDSLTLKTFNFAQFIESRVTDENLTRGWVAYDGWDYFAGNDGGPTFSNLTSGQGYNYYDDVNAHISFEGQLNTSDVTVDLSYSDVSETASGFNLLGNPFMSGLDWDQIIDSSYYDYPDNTSTGLYFTRDDEQCSYIAGVGNPGDVTGIIPPMQGFFVHTTSTDNTIILPAAARVNNNIHLRYKGKTIIPLVRLSIEEGTTVKETVIRFDEHAQSGLDNKFDAISMFLSEDRTSIYSYDEKTKYAINGLPFPDNELTVPIAINITEEGNHVISAMELQGLDDYDVILNDNLTGYTTDLKTSSDLTFNTSPGEITDRFTVTFKSLITGIDEDIESKESFNIYTFSGYLNIQNMSDQWNNTIADINIYDLTGRLISKHADNYLYKGETIQLPFNRPIGIYLIEITNEVRRTVQKLSHR